MSINVTVSGNPVSIKRGKMVVGDGDTKNEFDRRRLMRIKQVRDQSSDIAENIRNKVKKSKSRQAAEVVKEGEAQLKNWQARRLLDLQNQYQQALGDIGLGHRQAIEAEKEEEEYRRQQARNDVVRKERGRVASGKLQIDKNEESLKKAVPKQRRSLARDVENSRSNSVILRKSPFKKQGQKSKRRRSVDSDTENHAPGGGGGGDDDDNDDGSDVDEGLSISKMSKGQQTISQTSTHDKSAQVQEADINAKTFSNDTRISERIRRRHITNRQPDYCDLAQKDESDNIDTITARKPTAMLRPDVCTCCQCPRQAGTQLPGSTLHSQEAPTSSNLWSRQPLTMSDNTDNSRKMTTQSFETYRKGDVDDFPKVKVVDKTVNRAVPKAPPLPRRLSPRKPPGLASKTKIKRTEPPRLTLKSTKTVPDKIKYYDHPNRFSGTYVPTAQLEQIQEEDLEISPTLSDPEDLRREMKKRDLKAHMRGKVAQERLKAQREYKDLINKLPALQKQERIGEIGLDKPEYHMGDDRLRERERQRQNQLDNRYEELFSRAGDNLVTIPPRGEWDSAEPRRPDRTRMQKLSDMLEELTRQKEQLLREIDSTLPSDENLSQLAQTLRTRSLEVNGGHKRKRDQRLPSSSEEESSSSSNCKPCRMVSPQKKSRTSGTTTRPVLILQNTSTQTTPKVGQSAATSPIVQAKVDRPCLCPQQEDFEIVIKLKDADQPEVSVNPPLYENNVRIISEQSTQAGADKSMDKSVAQPHKTAPKTASKSPRKATSKTPPETASKTAPTEPTSTSWREQFSRASTSSTSYLDPPNTSLRSSHPKRASGSQSSPETTHRLNGTTSSSSSRNLDPKLLNYIKKLLNMSHATIDALAVSSASDVTTPSPSVVETPPNIPLAHLRQIMKYYHLDGMQLKKQLLNQSEDGSLRYNSVQSASLSPRSEKTAPFKSCVDVSAKTMEEADRLSQYADIAESCNRKISSLTAMIEKVRAEKSKIMGTSSADTVKPTEDVSSSSSPKEENLLGIDLSYAERLKRLTSEELANERQLAEKSSSDEDLLAKLQQMMSSSKSGDVVTVSEKITVQFAPETKMDDDDSIYLDIPKLPRLEQEKNNNKRRPPPCKGLLVLNGNMAPHELSTIAEADSQVSTKSDSPMKPLKSILTSKATSIAEEEDEKGESMNSSETEAMESMLHSIGMEWAIPTLKKTREALALTSSSTSSDSSKRKEVSLREFLAKISDGSSSENISLVQMDQRRTSTPVQGMGLNEVSSRQMIFSTSSDLSSVREPERSSKTVFFDLEEKSASRVCSDDCPGNRS